MMFVVYMWSAVVFVFLSLWKRMSFVYERSTPWFHDTMSSLGISQVDYFPADHHFPVWEHFFTTLVFFVCFGVSIALAFLGSWHLYLITRAETSIEFYTNRHEASDMRREGKKFVNKYNYGRVNNWRVFLGLKTGRSFMCHVLLPSGHTPLSNGMDWETEGEELRKVTGFSPLNSSVADMI
jgi:palmitoyltransferase